MKTLVFGKTGQVAAELRGHAGVVCLDRSEADLTDPQACARKIADHAPDAVINAAAYTAVDRAENEPELAHAINATAPAAMARATADLGIPLVHISTDYVFDGSGATAWVPSDPPDPINTYGITKLAGENGIRGVNGVHGILRTSWVFSAHGSNFLKTMLRLGQMKDQLNVVSDQIGGPTPANAIAAACLEIARQLIAQPDKSGTYHFAGTPDVSWAGFARAIMKRADLACKISDIPSTDYPTPARRPLNSRLDCSGTGVMFGIRRPDWKMEMGVMIDALTQKRNAQKDEV